MNSLPEAYAALLICQCSAYSERILKIKYSLIVSEQFTGDEQNFGMEFDLVYMYCYGRDREGLSNANRAKNIATM